MGPVWEANHVWLIFVIVVLFTCFPRAYAVASIALFWPLHLVLAGIVLRGAAFVFRAYHAASAGAELGWSRLFGAASALTPVLLGACLGAISTGDIVLVNGIPGEDASAVWLGRFPMATGLLAFLLQRISRRRVPGLGVRRRIAGGLPPPRAGDVAARGTDVVRAADPDRDGRAAPVERPHRRAVGRDCRRRFASGASLGSRRCGNGASRSRGCWPAARWRCC